MKKIIHNSNPVKNPVTNLLAYMLIIICIALKVIPMFMDVKQQVDDFFIYLLGFIGLILVFIPDEFSTVLKRTLNRKADEI